MTLVVVQAIGLVTIQDLGRPGHMHEGVAPGGALVRTMSIAANRAAGNDDDAATIEVLGKLVVRAERAIETSRGFLRAGAELTIESEPHRVAYLAIRGGVDAPLVLGSRATQLSAGIGARIRTGDRISAAPDTARGGQMSDAPDTAHRGRMSDAADTAHRGRMSDAADTAHRGRMSDAADTDAADTARRGRMSDAADTDAPDTARGGRMSDAADTAHRGRMSDAADAAVRVIAGPDSDAFAAGAIDVWVGQSYRVLPTSDRVGVRLLAIEANGADRALLRVAEYRDRSRPMVRGAIEVPPDGQPIVLGPEHPTTGGYPIIAVVAHDELDRVFAIRAGDVVRFHT